MSARQVLQTAVVDMAELPPPISVDRGRAVRCSEPIAEPHAARMSRLRTGPERVAVRWRLEAIWCRLDWAIPSRPGAQKSSERVFQHSAGIAAVRK